MLGPIMGGSKKILIVEDEEIIRNLCQRILAKAGYELTFAGGFREAMEKIQGSSDLDLLMTDMKLPDGDGIEVISCFRRKYPKTRVLIVTGSPTPDRGIERLRQAGLSEEDMLFKPFEMKEFEARIRACLEDV